MTCETSPAFILKTVKLSFMPSVLHLGPISVFDSY